MSTALPRLWLAEDSAQPERFELDAGEVAACTRGRTPGHSQDGMLLAQPHGDALLAVADGAGGLPGGGRAAELSLRSLLRAVQDSPVQDDSLRHGVLGGFDAGNSAIIALGSGSACTLTVVVIDHAVLRTYHAGDSGAFVTGQRGRLKFATIPHSPVGYAVEAGYLSEDEALAHEERHLVSNMLGSPEMRIELGPALALNPRDTVVVGSDGLFDNLQLDEIVGTVRSGPLSRAATQLAATIEQRMDQPAEGEPSKPDDYSFMLFRPGRT